MGGRDGGGVRLVSMQVRNVGVGVGMGVRDGGGVRLVSMQVWSVGVGLGVGAGVRVRLCVG